MSGKRDLNGTIVRVGRTTEPVYTDTTATGSRVWAIATVRVTDDGPDHGRLVHVRMEPEEMLTWAQRMIDAAGRAPRSAPHAPTGLRGAPPRPKPAKPPGAPGMNHTITAGQTYHAVNPFPIGPTTLRITQYQPGAATADAIDPATGAGCVVLAADLHPTAPATLDGYALSQERPATTGHCLNCQHPWGDHPGDGEGCQHAVMLGGIGPYDCNCQKTP